ncbi:hypothetical protein CVT25_008092 [Psilocybe cyanescens]|uniref:Uncharacterized protein n=1 Tax=Psilocybe cyanescens TaxID=93625 RepID=A0A409X6U4_PSICY|nr:hypothetical protein CVT25_008092 [Psilocybe cyanescens]
MEAERERGRPKAGNTERVGAGMLYIGSRDTKARARSILEEGNDEERRKVAQIFCKHAFPYLLPMIHISLVTDVLTFMLFSLVDLRFSNDLCVFSNTSTSRTKAPVNTTFRGRISYGHPSSKSTSIHISFPSYSYFGMHYAILNASHQKPATGRRIPFYYTKILQSHDAMTFLGVKQNRLTGRLSSSSCAHPEIGSEILNRIGEDPGIQLHTASSPGERELQPNSSESIDSDSPQKGQKSSTCGPRPLVQIPPPIRTALGPYRGVEEIQLCEV